MKITNNKVVAIEYHLTDDDGEVIDSSRGDEPLLYLHGCGNIVAGLESELDGRESGDQFKISLTPDQGYGERQDDLIHTVNREDFEDAGELEIGMQFELPEEEGGLMFIIAEINEDDVVIDANHELAGMNLNFDIKVEEVRDASPEEIEHQHAHYPDDDHEHCE